METYLAIIKLIINLMFGMVMLLVSIRIFDLLTKDIEEMVEVKKRNQSVGLILSAIIISLSIMLVDVFNESFIVLNFDHFIKTLTIDIMRFVFTMLVGTISIFVAYQLFKYLNSSRFNVVVELKNGNMAVAMMLAAYILALTLLVTPALKHLFFTLFFGYIGNYEVK